MSYIRYFYHKREVLTYVNRDKHLKKRYDIQYITLISLNLTKQNISITAPFLLMLTIIVSIFDLHCSITFLFAQFFIISNRMAN